MMPFELLAQRGNRDDLTRRTARVLTIIARIHRDPYRWTRKRLASEFEVSERMISKDMYLIRYKLGLPLRHDSTGYWFVRSYDQLTELCDQRCLTCALSSTP